MAGAGMALQAVWWEKHGHHFKGIFDTRLEELVDGQLLKYARAVATEGVRSRYRSVPQRRKALPHPSAQEHVREIMAAL